MIKQIAVLGMLLAVGIGDAAASDAKANAPSSTRVVFETSRSQLLLPVQIGASPGPHWFILDCAVDPSVVDETLLASEQVVLLGNATQAAQGAGDGDGLAVRPAQIQNYRLGEMKFSQLEAVAADLSGFSQSLGRPLAGILGYSFLKDKVVRINYANSSVDIAYQRNGLQPLHPRPSKSYVVPLTFMSPLDLIPVVELAVPAGTVRVSVDTGSSLGLQLYTSAVAELRLEPLRQQAQTAKIVGARGEANIQKTSMDGIRLGPFVEDAVAVSFSDRAHNPAERQGNIGNQFLQRFVVTIDYIAEELVFEQ